jgi:uncharacterized protein (DUF2141 family)
MILAALVVLNLGCPPKVTGIKGKLILQTGQTGDVRNCRVQAFQGSDLTGNPVKEVASSATGVDQTKSDFEFTDMVAGYYYILAWKDLNGSSKVDNLDIVGIHGGTYRPGYGGSQVTVTDGKETDVGEIVMLIFKELILTVTSARDVNQGINFTYSFNNDCSVTTWQLAGPGGVTGSDPAQAGSKTASTQYTSGPWSYTGGDPLPSGQYVVTVAGSWNSGVSFSLADTVSVN